MLMNHKNFHFTQIPDKTNDVMSKNHVFGPFVTIFGHFCPMGIFPKKIRLCHTTRYGPLTPCYVSEKTNGPILRKLTDRRKEGRTDRPYFIGSFRPRPGVQKRNFIIFFIRLKVYHSKF